VELPIIAERARVHDTSYIIETNPETASVIRTSLSTIGFELDVGDKGAAPSAPVRRDEGFEPGSHPDSHMAKRPMATLTVAMINVVRILPIPGIKTSAANRDPAAAPNVFSAYNTPTLRSTSSIRSVKKRVSTGSVPPIKNVGVMRTTKLVTNRMKPAPPGMEATVGAIVQ
jgi:hypothetical protein